MLSKLHIRLVQVFALLLCCIASAAYADTTVNIPRPYAVYLVDGQKHNHMDTNLHFAAGEHQVVIRYEGNFGNRSQIRLINGEPVVINFTTNGQENLKVEYPLLNDAPSAEAFLANQEHQLHLIDLNTKAEKTATIFQMPKKEGLQIGRDYQEELVSMGKAFQQPIINNDGTISVTTPNGKASMGTAGLSNKNMQSLEMLKYWYNRADPTTRKAFQVWIINQQ